MQVSSRSYENVPMLDKPIDNAEISRMLDSYNEDRVAVDEIDCQEWSGMDELNIGDIPEEDLALDFEIAHVHFDG